VVARAALCAVLGCAAFASAKKRYGAICLAWLNQAGKVCFFPAQLAAHYGA